MASQSLPPHEIIRAVIETAESKEDHDLARAFNARDKIEPNLGWSILGQIFDFHFRAENAAAPFGPMLVMDDRRSMIPDDLSDDQLDALRSTLDGVEDPEYRARIGDICWLRRRDANAARIAVEAYVASGTRLEDPEHWVASMERYQRAIRLARQVEPKGDLPKTVLAHLEGRVRHYDGNDPQYFSLKALELLAEFRFGEFSALGEIAGRIAVSSRAAGDFERARGHYAVEARLWHRAGRQDKAEAALVSRAECFFEEAEAREAGDSAMTAHHFWQEAVKAFRERPSLRGRVQELQTRLAAAGRKTLDEMKSVGGEIDIRKEVEDVKKMFRGLSWDDALYTFVSFAPLIDPNELRDETMEVLRKNPLQSFLKADIFDEEGRKIAVRPPYEDDQEKQAAALEGFMDQNARLHRGYVVHACLAPAMRTILAEHSIDETALEKLIAESRFIPEGRLPFFVKAIAEGFRWDFSTALHILVPQAENGLRYLLEQQGVMPRSINQEGVETAWSCERVLDHEKMVAMLGSELLYELRSLLAGRLGPNLRNLIAHGLASPATLHGPTAFYLWWVLLRLTVWPTDGMKAFLEREEGRRADA